MTIDQLRKAQRAEPFQPYTLRLASGRSIRVRSREFVAESGTGRTISVWTDDDNAFDVVDLLLVETLEIGNGRRSKRSRR